MTFLLDLTGTLIVFIFLIFAIVLLKKENANKLSNIFFLVF